MRNKKEIRDFSGKLLAITEELENGDTSIRDYSGKCLGFYRKKYDITTDFSGRTIARGDALSSLIEKK
jgi:hypothetical protein